MADFVETARAILDSIRDDIPLREISRPADMKDDWFMAELIAGGLGAVAKCKSFLPFSAVQGNIPIGFDTALGSAAARTGVVKTLKCVAGKVLSRFYKSLWRRSYFWQKSIGFSTSEGLPLTLCSGLLPEGKFGGSIAKRPRSGYAR